jgi:outer membrane protein OmpA-like peptidoglycan-associated protein
MSRISYKGYGASQPLFPNDTPDNRKKNRRIEFRINSK